MTVGLVIVSHSSQLARGIAELAEQVTKKATPIAAAGGAGEGILGTSADTILAAIQSVYGPDGVLVLLDMGSAIMSTEIALELLTDEQRSHVMLSFGPIVEGAITAALEASLGHHLAQVKHAAEKIASAEQLQLLKPFGTPEQSGLATTVPVEPVAEGDVQTVSLTVTNHAGLHARPASLFVQTASRFQATIQLRGRGRQAEATSIIGILSLGVRQGDTLTIHATGREGASALEALSELVRTNFYEIVPATGSSSSPATTATAQSISLASKHWRGVPASPGVALGVTFLYTAQIQHLSTVERRSISSTQVAAEQQRLNEALMAITRELQMLAQQLRSQVASAEAAIFDAQALMLRDPLLLKASLRIIEEQRIDAASALVTTGEHYAMTLETLDDARLAGRAADVRDVVRRTVQRLRGQPALQHELSTLKQPVILLARDLTPSDTVLLHPNTVLGICTTQGSPAAHTAILARALGIPAITGISETVLHLVHSGEEIGLDGDNGILYPHPTPEVRAALTLRLTKQRQKRNMLKTLVQRAQKPLSINGRRIHLFANISSEAEAKVARQWGAQGVGLLRTEFLFGSVLTLPSEEEQRQHYARVFRAFKNTGPIVVRTLDVGADKPIPAIQTIVGTEANPALGLRGIRIHLAHQELLEQQLRALLLAAGDTSTDLHIMFPMITTVEEMQAVRAIFTRVYEDMKQRQICVPAHVPLGVMLEVPASAIMAPALANLADFFSIGTNDLLQYTLACDRTNSSLSDLYHPMQPAVLKLIHRVAAAGRRLGKPVAVCGEMASDVRLAPFLIGSGVDELSMIPSAIPAVRAALAGRSAEALAELAEQISHLSTVAEVEAACTHFQMRRLT